MKQFYSYVQITLGAILMAVGLELFHVPHNMVVGGVSGIGIITLDLSERFLPFTIPLWLTNAGVNLPLLLLSYKTLGKEVFIKSLYTILTVTVTLMFTHYLPDIEPDLFIGAIFGGVVIGVATGLIIRQGATSGGTTLMAALSQRYLKLGHLKLTNVILFFDFSIIVIGMIVFEVLITLYAIISIVIILKVADIVIQGISTSKAVFILSKEYEAIGQALLAEIPRGLTALSAKGVYTGNQKDMLLCVMSQKEMVRVREIVQEIDTQAFVIVTTVTEVLGNGFRPLAKENGLV